MVIIFVAGNLNFELNFYTDNKIGNNNNITFKSDVLAEDPFGVAASLVPQSILQNQKNDIVKNNSKMNC